MRNWNDLTKPTVDKAIAAMEQGKIDEAKSLVRSIWEETRPVHDMYGDVMASLLTFIAKKLGEEAVEEAHRYAAEDVWKPMLLAMKHQGVDRFSEMFAFYLRTHGFNFRCEEDAEKIVFVARYCPSGGRLMKEGKNEDSKRHPNNFGVTYKAYPWSFNKVGISYYCCHCPLWMEILPREWGWDILRIDFGRQFDEAGNCVDEPCKMTIYKKPQS